MPIIKRSKRKTASEPKVPEPFPKGKPSKEDIDATREFLRETGGAAAVEFFDAVEKPVKKDGEK